LKFLKNNWIFVVMMVIWIISILPFLALYSKADIHLYLNQWHSPFGDAFFKYATYLGDGLVGGIVILLLILFQFRSAVATIIAFLGSAIFTQVLKRFVFDDHFRPSKFFENIAELHLIDGVNMHSHFSFPSGHSTAAFSLFCMLTFISKPKLLKVSFMLSAMTAAYSRVYLSQHFLEDIYVGSIIGSTFAIISFQFFETKTWGETGLIAWVEQKLKS